MLKKFRNNLLLFFQLIILIYFVLLIFLYFYQRNLMYHPSENNYFDDKLSVQIKKVNIKTEDNIELLGWYHEKKGLFYIFLNLFGDTSLTTQYYPL